MRDSVSFVNLKEKKKQKKAEKKAQAKAQAQRNGTERRVSVERVIPLETIAKV